MKRRSILDIPPVPKGWEAIEGRKHALRDEHVAVPPSDNRKSFARGMVSTLSGLFVYRTVGSGSPRYF